MANITKKMKLTTVKYVTTVVEDGAAKVVDMPMRAFPGTVSQNRIIKALKKELGDVSFTILSIDTAERTYSMDLDTFLQHATVVAPSDTAEPDNGAAVEEPNSEDVPPAEEDYDGDIPGAEDYDGDVG